MNHGFLALSVLSHFNDYRYLDQCHQNPQTLKPKYGSHIDSHLKSCRVRVSIIHIVTRKLPVDPSCHCLSSKRWWMIGRAIAPVSPLSDATSREHLMRSVWNSTVRSGKKEIPSEEIDQSFQCNVQRVWHGVCMKSAESLHISIEPLAKETYLLHLHVVLDGLRPQSSQTGGIVVKRSEVSVWVLRVFARCTAKAHRTSTYCTYHRSHMISHMITYN